MRAADRCPPLKRALEVWKDVTFDYEPTDTPERYGVITPESRDGRLIKMKGMVEKPDPAAAPSNLAVIRR